MVLKIHWIPKMEKPTKPAGKAFRQSKNMRTARFCGFITMSDPPSNKKTALGNFPKAELRGARCALAEKEGFEPSMSYQPIHEFQSCAINRARRLLHSLLLLFHYSYNSIAQNKVLVNSGKHFFCINSAFLPRRTHHRADNTGRHTPVH